MSVGSGEPSVTVVSVWHNRAAWVEESVRSMLNQTLRNVRVVLVDDGSTDGTGTALEGIARTSALDVDVFRFRNRGFSRTLERVTNDITTTFVALHGAGDVSDERRLKAQLQHAVATGAAVVGCGVGSIGPSGTRSGLERSPRDCASGAADVRKLPRPGTHGAAFIRTAALQSCGGYRSAFRYSQDADLWLRISSVGSFDGVPGLLYWKRRGDGVTVAGSATLRFAQALYGELARQCHEDRLAHRPDLVECHGDDAVLFLRPTERLRSRILKSPMDEVVHDSVRESLLWRSFADREREVLSRLEARFLRPDLRRFAVWLTKGMR